MAIKEIVDRSAEAADDDHWIGPKPSVVQMSAVLLVGTVALIIAGVQPLLLGALVDEHRLSATALGWTVTLEFLTIGLGVGLAESLFASNRLRLRGLIAAAVLFAVNIAATRQSEAGIMAARAVAGLAEGVLGWIVSLMITRSSTPARLNGIFLVAQGLAQILFAAILPLTLMKTLGANGGFYALAGTAIVAGAAVLVIPDDMMPLPEAKDEPRSAKGGTLSRAGVSSLAAVVLLYAFFIGFFAYLGQLAGQARLGPELAGFAVAASLGASIIGSGLAAAFAKRISYYAVYLVCLPVNSDRVGRTGNPSGHAHVHGPECHLRLLLGLFYAVPVAAGHRGRSDPQVRGFRSGRDGAGRRWWTLALLLLCHRHRRSRCACCVRRLSAGVVLHRHRSTSAADGGTTEAGGRLTHWHLCSPRRRPGRAEAGQVSATS